MIIEPILTFDCWLNGQDHTGGYACFLCAEGSEYQKEDLIAAGERGVLSEVFTHIGHYHDRVSLTGTFTVNDQTRRATIWFDGAAPQISLEEPAPVTPRQAMPLRASFWISPSGE